MDFLKCCHALLAECGKGIFVCCICGVEVNTFAKREDFREKDKMLTICLEEMDSLLSKELKEKFDNVMKLTYQVEEYYFTLAYLLGSKYREKLKGI